MNFCRFHTTLLKNAPTTFVRRYGEISYLRHDDIDAIASCAQISSLAADIIVARLENRRAGEQREGLMV